MRWKEICTEAATYSSVARKIERDCSEFLTVSRARENNRLLFRGFKSARPDFFSDRSHNDRKPRDTVPKMQEAIDNWLSKNGFTARRANSVFTTADPIVAKKYGDVYAVFPKNGFHYTWFQVAFDLYVARGTFFRFLAEISGTEPDGFDYPKHLQNGFWKEEDVAAAMEKFMDWAEPTSSNLSKAMSTDHEIMVNGEFYAVKKGTVLYEFLLNKLYGVE